MSRRTLSNNIVLEASADDIWGACKYAGQILTNLMPDVFSKLEFVKGSGEPGSIRVLTVGLGVEGASQLKERVDKVDDVTKTFGYTVIEGDPLYTFFSAEVQIVPIGTTKAEAKWTATFEPIEDHEPDPEHIKAMFKALEHAVRSRKTLKLTETLQASPESIWEASKQADEILRKALPQYFESTTMIQEDGGPSSISIIKTGPAITWASELIERLDTVDEANLKVEYTVLKGDERYKHLAATMEFSAGTNEGTTIAEWVCTYVPKGDMGPPEHFKAIVQEVWKALTDAANASL